MSKPQLEDDEKVIEECSSCGESMLSVYIKDSLCYRCQPTDADD